MCENEVSPSDILSSSGSFLPSFLRHVQKTCSVWGPQLLLQFEPPTVPGLPHVWLQHDVAPPLLSSLDDESCRTLFFYCFLMPTEKPRRNLFRHKFCISSWSRHSKFCTRCDSILSYHDRRIVQDCAEPLFTRHKAFVLLCQKKKKRHAHRDCEISANTSVGNPTLEQTGEHKKTTGIVISGRLKVLRRDFEAHGLSQDGYGSPVRSQMRCW